MESRVGDSILRQGCVVVMNCESLFIPGSLAAPSFSTRQRRAGQESAGGQNRAEGRAGQHGRGQGQGQGQGKWQGQQGRFGWPPVLHEGKGGGGEICL